MLKRAIIVGLGVMGTHHLRVLGALPGVEVVAVVDPDEERRREALDAHPHTAGFARLDEALARVDADFACLAAPVPELPPLAHLVIDQRLAVLVEKPMAVDEADAAAVVAAAAAAGVQLAVGHVERCNPAVMALRAKLDEGAVGEVIQLHARRLSPYPDRDSMQGVALDLATHDIDVMRFLTGSDVRRVYAETTRRRHDRAEDLLCATMRFDSGATGLLETNWLTPTKVRQLDVTGERGMFVVDYLTQDLTFYAHPVAENAWDALAGMRGPGEGDMVRYALARREPLRVQWEAFVAGRPVATGEDGLAALSIARAIQRAGGDGAVAEPRHRGTA